MKYFRKEDKEELDEMIAELFPITYSVTRQGDRILNIGEFTFTFRREDSFDQFIDKSTDLLGEITESVHYHLAKQLSYVLLDNKNKFH